MAYDTLCKVIFSFNLNLFLIYTLVFLILTS